jgi:hypothetical protein
MPRIKYTVEHIITKLREAEVALSKGQTVVQVSRSLGITEQSCGTNCSMARSLKRVGKPRCSSNAGGAPTTRFARTARWAIHRRLPRPGNLGTRNVPRLTRDVVQQSGAGHWVCPLSSPYLFPSPSHQHGDPGGQEQQGGRFWDGS